jgi:hypothetical protein
MRTLSGKSDREPDAARLHCTVSGGLILTNLNSEPGVVDAFSKVYATDDLIVSFDAGA